MASTRSGTKGPPNREEQCRFCLKSSRTRVKITKILRQKFLDVTQSELPVVERLSNFLCPKCSNALKNAHTYRNKLIETQKDLMKEISSTFMPELINVKQEKFDFEEIITNNCDNLDIEVKQEVVEEKTCELEETLMEQFDNFPFDEIIDFDEEPKTELDEKSEEKPKPKVIPEYKCEHDSCGLIFDNRRKYFAHIKSQHPEAVRRERLKKRRKICSYCGHFYCSKAGLLKHIQSVHLKAKNYFCDLCGYSAAIRCQLRSHMKTHMSERPKFKCSMCEFETICQPTLKRHEQHEHHGFKVTCHCGKTFSHKAALQIHVNIVHLKLKNHVCDTCGKKFYSKYDLVNHKKMRHETISVYEFSCDVCGKQFCTKKQLMRHKPYHTEAKFACNVNGCEKSYITEKKLERHMKVHIGDRDLQCHLCEKAYFFTRDLQRHLDVAHKQTTFFCELCSFTNNRKDYLCNHIRSAHPHIPKDERNKMVGRAKFIRNPV